VDLDALVDGFTQSWMRRIYSEACLTLARLALKRRLMSQSAVVGYLLVWGLMVASLLTLLGVMVSIVPPQGTILGWALGIVLLVPLARIGFGPIALAWNRHG
jgi:hypothetical protein